LHRFCLIHPCDRRTDGRTDRQTELRWLRRAIAVPAVARKNYSPKPQPKSTILIFLSLNRQRFVFYDTGIMYLSLTIALVLSLLLVSDCDRPNAMVGLQCKSKTQ